MITLRDLAITDLDTLVSWRNDPDVSRYLADRLKSPDEAEKWYNRLTANPGVWLKAILRDELLVGYCTVEAIDKKNRKCELALVVGEKTAWGSGIGRTVLEDMLRYAFDELNMHRVWAAVARGNERSKRLLRRAGFIQEGIMREPLIIAGEYIDLLCYSLLEDEYEKRSDYR